MRATTQPHLLVVTITEKSLDCFTIPVGHLLIVAVAEEIDCRTHKDPCCFPNGHISICVSMRAATTSFLSMLQTEKIEL
jgi:hypothetical protein